MKMKVVNLETKEEKIVFAPATAEDWIAFKKLKEAPESELECVCVNMNKYTRAKE